jgi:hypothetical protein
MNAVSPDVIEREILRLAGERGSGKTFAPTDVARALAGDDPDAWSRLMTPVRRAAVRLMQEGRIVIYRKGRPVDPENFRGVYRIGLSSSVTPEPGPGSKSGV